MTLWVISDRGGRSHTPMHVRLPRKRTNSRPSRQVRFVPKPDSCTAANAVTGAQSETHESAVFRSRLCAIPRRRLAAIGKSEDFLRVLYAAQMVKSE
jgi:hypothetical protein